MIDILKMAQGSAELICEDTKVMDVDAITKDNIGLTHPNLHRRINTPPEGSMCKKYALGIYGLYSYRTTEYNVHDEESTTSEIP